LLEGADGIQALMKEADALGRTMSGKDAVAAAEYVDAMNRLKSVVVGVKNQIGAALAPAMTELGNTFVAISKPVREFISQNREMILFVALGGAALLSLGAAITTAGFAFMGIGAALGAVASAIAFIVSPVGIAIAAIAALGTAVFKYTDYGAKAVQFFIDTFEPLGTVISDTFATVQNALATGDLNAAFDAIADGLEFTWLSIVDSMKDYWRGFMDYFFEISKAVTKAVGSLFEKLGGVIKSLSDAYGNYYNSVFNSLTEFFGEMNGVRTIGGGGDAWNDGGGIGMDFSGIGDSISDFGVAMQDSADGIGASSKADREARDAERRARMDALKKDIAASGQQSRKEIEDRRGAAPDRPDLQNLLDGLQDGMDQGGEKMTSAARGTFSGFGAMFLGGQQSIQKDQLNVQKQIAENTEQMVEQGNGAEFV